MCGTLLSCGDVNNKAIRLVRITPLMYERKDTSMRIRYKVLIAWAFFEFLSWLIFPHLVAHVQPVAQELTAPPELSAPSSPPVQSQRIPWYRDPARMALVGAISGAVVGAVATTCAAFMTGLINLRVRKITNEHELRLRELIRQHELQKLSVQKQLEVCGSFAEQIVKFNLIKPGDLSVGIFDALVDVMAAFERSYPFLDKQTAKTFDEQISIPFKNQEFVKMYQERGVEALYNEVRQRLMRHVLPTLRAFLDSIK